MPRRTGKKREGVNWLNWFIGTALFALVAVVVTVFGFLGWMKSYLHGEDFRELVSRKLSGVLKADGSFEEIHWTGSSAYSDGYAARGYAEAPFSRITANGIRADLDFGAMRERLWKIDAVGLNRLVLLIDEGNRLAGSGAGAVAETEEEPGFFMALLPSTVELGEISIVDANLVVEGSEGGRSSLSSVEARLRKVKGSKAWAVSGKGGKLVMPGVPELEIDSFVTRLQGKELFITDAACTLLNGARLTASGEVGVGGDRGIELRLKISDLDTDEVVGPQWSDKVSGIVGGETVLDRTEGGALRKKGSVEVDKAVLEGMEVLDLVADYAKAERFRRLVLHEARADFEQVGDRLEITNLVLQSDGLTRLTGSMVIEGGLIEGNFRVGVTPGTLKWIPGAEQKVFVEPGDGFLWTHLRVAGPVGNPSEDLSGRLKVAAVKAVVEGAVSGVLEVAPGGSVKGGKAAVDAGVKAGKTAVDVGVGAGKAILDTLTPILK